MKFILSESNAKLILNERFILNEDDAAPADSAEKKAFYEQAKKYDDELLKKLQAKTDAVAKATTDYKNNPDIKELAELEKKAKEAINKADFGEVAGPVNAYTNKVRELANQAQNGNGYPLSGAPELNRKLGQLDALAQKLQTDLDNAEKYDLLQKIEDQLNIIATDVNSTINKNAKEAVDKSGAEKSDDDKNFDNLVANTWSEVDKTTQLLSNYNDTEDAAKQIIKDLTSKITLPDGIENKEINEISTFLTNAYESCKQFNDKVAEDAKNKTKADFKAKAAAASAGASDNWKKAFEDAGRDPDAVASV